MKNTRKSRENQAELRAKASSHARTQTNDLGAARYSLQLTALSLVFPLFLRGFRHFFSIFHEVCDPNTQVWVYKRRIQVQTSKTRGEKRCKSVGDGRWPAGICARRRLGSDGPCAHYPHFPRFFSISSHETNPLDRLINTVMKHWSCCDAGKDGKLRWEKGTCRREAT